jgi:hypothetical protein
MNREPGKLTWVAAAISANKGTPREKINILLTCFV